MMATCHCSRCRKVGASTFVFIKRKDIKWVSGKALIACYTPAPPHKYPRCFCEICGSSLGEILSEDERFPIPANIVDSPLELNNKFHEFVADKPSWYEICDKAEQFSGHPTGS